MNRRIKVAADAESEIERIDEWWRANRRSNPRLFQQELRQAFNLISQMPGSGRLIQRSGHQEIRRVLLQRTQYYLFYRYNSEEVDILILWSARFEGPPEL